MITFINQLFMVFRLVALGCRDWSEVSAWCRRMATGSLGGVPLKVRVRLSRQNCMRRAPTVGLETSSGIRTSSMFRARIARYASSEDGGRKVCRV